ncbi:MAG: universal stress protein [Woeseiaceae bacterium]|nr:universal stress protein [Woeseiaceae bacterium]
MKRFSNILLVVDDRTDSSAALKRATTLARSNNAHLTVCAGIDANPDDVRMRVITVSSREVLDVAIEKTQEWLTDIVASVAADDVSIDTKVLVGKPFIEIIRQVLRDDHDLLIKSADADRGLREMLFSSTDKHLMRKCPCPVWIIKPTERQKYLRILAAVDEDPGEPVKDVLNRQILEMFTSMALTEYSEAHVVHAWQVFGEGLLKSHKWDFSEGEFEAMLEEEASGRRRWLQDLVTSYGDFPDTSVSEGPELRLHVIKGPAEQVVPELARELEVDLVVMGTVARTGIGGFFMGNTAESILGELDCSVLTMKPPGFTSPVTLEE